MYVGTAEKVSERRQSSNKFFLLLNSTIIGLKSWMNCNWINYLLGIMLSILWFFNIVSFQKLNRAKFQVIHEMEIELPYAPFKKEEELYNNDQRWDFSAIEKWIPVVFCVVYLIKWCN
jgi:hypothetical protein